MLQFINWKDDMEFKRYYSFKEVKINGKLIIYKDGNRLGKKATTDYFNRPLPEVISRLQELGKSFSSKNGFIRKAFFPNNKPFTDTGLDGDVINTSLSVNPSDPSIDLDGDVICYKLTNEHGSKGMCRVL